MAVFVSGWCGCHRILDISWKIGICEVGLVYQAAGVEVAELIINASDDWAIMIRLTQSSQAQSIPSYRNKTLYNAATINPRDDLDMLPTETRAPACHSDQD